MSITRQVVSVSRLLEAQLAVFLRARDAFVTAGGTENAPAAAVLDEKGKLCEAMFYKDVAGQQMLARVRFGTDGAPQPVEWL
jgi:hypothetical protein